MITSLQSEQQQLDSQLAFVMEHMRNIQQQPSVVGLQVSFVCEIDGSATLVLESKVGSPQSMKECFAVGKSFIQICFACNNHR